MKNTKNSKILCTILCVLITSITFAQSKTLTAKKSNATEYFTLEANVEYPTVLKGNEAETKDYVEKVANTRKDYVVRMYNKGKTSFPKIITTFKKYNLPEELKVLIAIESAFNGNAVSPVGAVGYWQIMDFVAKEYGIKYIPRNLKNFDTTKNKIPTVDERKNFAKSTMVAAKYLRDRNRNLKNNILLVVASYNCGIGNVWKAMAKSGKTNPTYWDVKQFLPTETKNYVMNFVALNVLFKNYNKLVSNKLVFNTIKIKKGEASEKGTAKAF